MEGNKGRTVGLDDKNEARRCRRESEMIREEAKKLRTKAEWAESFPWFGMDPAIDDDSSGYMII